MVPWGNIVLNVEKDNEELFFDSFAYNSFDSLKLAEKVFNQKHSGNFFFKSRTFMEILN